MQLLYLLHHRGVDSQPSGCIDDQHVVVMLAREIQRGQRDILRLLAGVGLEEVHFELLRQRAQLFDRSGAVYVATDQQHFFLLLVAQQFGKLSAGGGFACALQAGHQDYRWRGDGKVERVVVPAHQTGEFSMHHADQRLAGVQIADDLLPERGLLDLGDEFLDDGQRDVSFKQRHAHFAQCILNVAFREARLAAQILDDSGKPLCKVVQHKCFA